MLFIESFTQTNPYKFSSIKIHILYKIQLMNENSNNRNVSVMTFKQCRCTSKTNPFCNVLTTIRGYSLTSFLFIS